MRLSVVIPTLEASQSLGATLDALASDRDPGIDLEVIVVDGGSVDATRVLAEARGARVIAAPPSRGGQLAIGAAAARGPWLLFLHADTRLDAGWARETVRFMEEPRNRRCAAYFRFALDDGAPAARRLEGAVALRCRLLALPYGDQGLLIGRAFYETLGGFRRLPVMEDVDLVRRIGRRRLARLNTPAVTSAARYRRDGWRRRSLRNLCCLMLYFLGLPPRLIRHLYA